MRQKIDINSANTGEMQQESFLNEIEIEPEIKRIPSKGGIFLD